MIDSGEDCDGANLGGADCNSATAGALPSGALACTGGCAFNISGCYNCGDGSIDGAEVCDGSDLSGETCVGLSYDGGTLGCGPGCLSYDESMCTTCGDNAAEGTELCDGSDLSGETCLTVGAFSGGSLGCQASCANWDTSGCFGPPTVPVLRKPMNNGYVGSIHVPGSLRPTFLWETSTVMGGALIGYDLEYSTDPSFSVATTTVNVTFTDFTPGTDLAVSSFPPVGGRYYWRVRACAGSACSAWSTVWWVNVGRDPGDVTGDGYADVIVAEPFESGGGTAYVYFGGPGGGLETTPDLTMVHQQQSLRLSGPQARRPQRRWFR